MSILNTYKKIFFQYIEYGWAPFIGMIPILVLGISDDWMVQPLGTDPYAGVGLANSIYNIPNLFIIGMNSVLSPLIIRLHAQGNRIKASSYFWHMIQLNILFAIGSTLVLYITSTQLYLFKQSPTIIPYAQTFIYLIATSLPFSAATVTIRRYLYGLNKKKVNAVLSILSVAVNVLLNFILINGHLHLPKLGIAGAGIATLITHIIIFIIYIKIAHSLIKKKLLLYPPTFSISTSYYLIRISTGSGLSLIVKVIYSSIIYMMLGNLASYMQAGMNFLNIFWRMAILLPVALSIAGSIIISKQINLSNKKNQKQTLQVGLFIAITSVIVLALLIRWKIGPILAGRQDKLNAETLQFIYKTLPFIIMIILADSINLVLEGILRGMQDTFLPFLYTLVSYIIGILIAYLLTFEYHLGGEGIFTGQITGMALTTMLLILRINLKKAKKITLKTKSNEVIP